GISSSSLNCAGNTSVPSLMVMPLPGPCRSSCHSGFLICLVILIGSDHVLPSSSLLTSTNCPVSLGSKPVREAFQARWPGMPCVQSPPTQMGPVCSSTKIDGSPTPFCSSGSPPHSSISIITCMGSQLLPPSVLRLIPTSISPCRSAELS